MKSRTCKLVETVFKTFIIMLYAAPLSWAATILWYLLLYRQDLHLDDRMEAITTAAWLPIFGILYSVLAAVMVGRVFEEYKDIRMAIKEYDIDKFARLRDEDLSPLLHGLLWALGGLVLAGFMSLSYPSFWNGFFVIGSTSYFFAFIFFIIREIDDPLHGIWFIKTVPEGWLELDVKAWLRLRQKEHEKNFHEQIESLRELAEELQYGDQHDID